jgi:cytochrome c553
MRLRTAARAFGAALLAIGATAATAQAPDVNQLRASALAATCANCHGTQGRGAEGSAVPAIAGMPAAYIAEQMRAFRSGARQATVMHQLAKGYSDAQIDQIAAYFAAQKR